MKEMQQDELLRAQSDIAARERAENALRESNELLSLFMRHSPIFAYIKEVTPTESRVIKASDNYRDMIGIPGSEMAGKTMQELFPPEFASKIAADDWDVVSNGKVLKLDEELNGRHYTTIKFPIFQGGKNLLAGYTIDITASKRAEEEREKLEAQNRQLQKSESLGRMAGAIAHHFNNQLQIVMMSLQMAMDDLPQNAGPAKFLADAMQSAGNAAEVSRSMLTYLGKTIAKREPLDLSGICRRHLPMLRAAIPKEVVLEADLPEPGPIVQANANQLQQIVTNLVTNAWEAGGKGQCVIRLAVKTAGASDISAANRFPIGWQSQDTAYACLEVADAGCGIAHRDLEKIFDPFFTSKFPGRGLGLSVVLGIVGARHGVVTVESEPDRGSVFRVFLPVSSESAHRRT
jgi:PAS domain S-box-containing protein